tara:strand:- start:3587 stop:4084 length:498 start_codon:yes stop_codon:yes gene_type:complete
MNKIIVTGPESSGKTTICNGLSIYFKVPHSKEFAREYLSERKTKYNQEDLLKIAKGQFYSEKNNIILDTDLITIKIWSIYKFKYCESWILDQIEKQKRESRIYLLCKPDIAWKPDPLRENQNNRMELFEMYLKELDDLRHKYYIIDGENKLEKSIKKISPILLKK